MGVTRWIGGALGWAFGGPIGAIIGLALGSLIDGAAKSDFPFFFTYGYAMKTK